MELKGTLRLNDELERMRKETLLQYLTTGSEEIPQTLTRMASFLIGHRNTNVVDGPCSKFSYEMLETVTQTS
jgi:hypothetical protein